MKIDFKLSLTLLSIALGLIGLYFVASWAVPKVLVTFTKAAPSNKVSLNDSLVIGAKILAKADNKDSCLVNIFLLDNNGKGVQDKRVQLTGAAELKIENLNAVTDKDGKASFEIKSETEGQFRLIADVDGVALPKTISVTFRN